jgi:hypothetical protein
MRDLAPAHFGGPAAHDDPVAALFTALWAALGRPWERAPRPGNPSRPEWEALTERVLDAARLVRARGGRGYAVTDAAMSALHSSLAEPRSPRQPDVDRALWQPVAEACLAAARRAAAAGRRAA